MTAAPVLRDLAVGESLVTTTPVVARAQLRTEIAVCVYADDGGVGGLVVLPEATGPDALLGKLVQQVAAAARVSYLRLVAKIVGPEGPTATRARVVLARDGVRVVGEETGDASKFELMFYTHTGRLRVAKEPLPPKKIVVAAAPAARRKARVLIVDDSLTIRRLLSRVLGEDPGLEVVGMAEDTVEAEKLRATLKPDVMTLDIDMPGVDGVTYLERLMAQSPMPVVMVTALSPKDGDRVLRSLELGAVDYVQKPEMRELATAAGLICEKVRVAAASRLRTPRAETAPRRLSALGSLRGKRLIAIGASTGGTEAIKRVLVPLPAEVPPIVIVQHIPPLFSGSFANRLNELCRFEVREAKHGDKLRPGLALLAPGGKHLAVRADKEGGWSAEILDTEAVNRHKPSVDVLFDSVARNVGTRTLGVILTGMGSDGAEGLLKMRQAGAATIAQDEASCTVYGMPREAALRGAAQEVLPLDDIAERVVKLLRGS